MKIFRKSPTPVNPEKEPTLSRPLPEPLSQPFQRRSFRNPSDLQPLQPTPHSDTKPHTPQPIEFVTVPTSTDRLNPFSKEIANETLQALSQRHAISLDCLNNPTLFINPQVSEKKRPNQLKKLTGLAIELTHLSDPDQLLPRSEFAFVPPNAGLDNRHGLILWDTTQPVKIIADGFFVSSFEPKIVIDLSDNQPHLSLDITQFQGKRPMTSNELNLLHAIQIPEILTHYIEQLILFYNQSQPDHPIELATIMPQMDYGLGTPSTDIPHRVATHLDYHPDTGQIAITTGEIIGRYTTEPRQRYFKLVNDIQPDQTVQQAFHQQFATHQ